MFGRRRRAQPPVDQQVDHLEAAGRRLEAVDLLERRLAQQPDAATELRLASLRNAAFAELDRTPGFAEWPLPRPPADGGPPEMPRCAPQDLTGERLRHGILGHGCLHVPGR